MCDTLNDLPNKRKAVSDAINCLYDELREELHQNTIKELKEQIRVLENDLSIYKQLLDDETKRANMYKEQCTFMRKVKTITVTN